jgi:hypothetical protein
MMELSEIGVGDELVLENGAEGEPVVVGEVGTRCVYATNHERAMWWSPFHSGFPGPHLFRGVSDE